MTLALSHPVDLADSDTGVAVRASALGKVIDDRWILAEVSFAVPTGAFVALLGANGAGKSTLLRVLATLTGATHGALHLLGRAVGRDTTSIRAQLGLIGHGPMLYRELSALENLVFFGRLYGLTDARRRALELLEYVELSTRADDPVKTFSRGMTQRVAIARALMHDPDLLLADEPFAGLDAPSQRMLEEMLRRLHRAGKTIVLANHDIGQSLDLADRALVLRGGRLVVDAATHGLDPEGVLAEITAS